MVSVLTAGHVNWDVTLRVDRLPEPDGEASIRSQRASGGGSAANVAVALRRLEVDAAVIGSVGDDENGLLARRELERAGVDLDDLRVVDGETAVKYLLVDDDGELSVLGTDGVNEAVRPEHVDPDRVRAADHLHLTSQHPETAAHLAAIASEAGVPVSFDPGRRLADRDYRAAIAAADVLFATDREAEALLESVAADVDGHTVVVKHGRDGASVRTPEETHVHPGVDVEAVDTAGAGDAFAAGFIATRLAGDDLEGALEYANACGALAASRDGARSAPTASDVVAVLENGR